VIETTLKWKHISEYEDLKVERKTVVTFVLIVLHVHK